jgi:hypothetical protein
MLASRLQRSGALGLEYLLYRPPLFVATSKAGRRAPMCRNVSVPTRPCGDKYIPIVAIGEGRRWADLKLPIPASPSRDQRRKSSLPAKRR